MLESERATEDPDFEVVIPTAPEDELSSSFSSTGSRPSFSSSLNSNSSVSLFQSQNLNTGSPSFPNYPNSYKGKELPPHPGRSGGKKSHNGLPSHAFSRNYYCRYCSFNTTKSKAHLYHLVDVHGVDIKIFSCDRCDYASKWKCKVIRHRKMIHKINEPKFEPEVHDTRGQSRPQPIPLTANPITKSPELAEINKKLNNNNLPTQVAMQAVYNQSHIASPLFPATNPFTQNPIKPDLSKPAELSKPAAPEGGSRRKQRKPQNVCKIVNGEDDGEAYYVPSRGESDKMATSVLPTTDDGEIHMETKDNNESVGIADLFGKIDSSDILSGGSWRKRLMPKAVASNHNNSHNNNNVEEKKSPVSQASGSQISLSSSHGSSMAESLASTQNQMNLISPSQPQIRGQSPSHRDQSPGQEDDMPVEDQIAMLKNNYVIEINIDEEPHFRCSECNFISKFRWKSTKHYKSKHLPPKQYKCQSCEFITTHKNEYYSHKATHSTRGMLKCDECAYVTSSKTGLERHMTNHREKNLMQCLYCSFSSIGEDTLHNHMAEHHNMAEIPLAAHKQYSLMQEKEEGECGTNEFGEFACDKCGYTARNWSKMKEHMIRHQDGTPFACSYCDSKYKRPADLNRHLKIKHNTCLADIGLDGPTLKGMGRNTEFMSPESSSFIASMKRRLEVYDGSTGGDDSDVEDPKRLCIDEEGMGTLKCPKCPYLAKWRSDLERHVKVCDKVHSEEKRFCCSICSRSYKYQGDLNVHMRKSHSAVQMRGQPFRPNIPSPNNNMRYPTSTRTPPPNVQVISDEVIVNMSHAAILNPLANLTPFPEYTSPPQMPSLQLAPNNPTVPSPSHKTVLPRKDSAATPEKRIKKGELDPSTMVHVPGGEFKCVNCCYETTFKSHLDAHMRLHPEKPFHCMFCNYASYWRGDTKKHIEKNHPDKLPQGVNPYNLVEQMFEEAVKSSANRHRPLPDVHTVHTSSKGDKSRSSNIWTPPAAGGNMRVNGHERKTPSLNIIQQERRKSPVPTPPKQTKPKDDGGQPHVQCPHCNYTTVNESRLNAHMATHYNLKIYKCPECGKRANWKWDVQKHMKQDHPSCIQDVIIMDTDEARNTLDEYLKDHPEQRGKPRIGVSEPLRADQWPKPRQNQINHNKELHQQQPQQAQQLQQQQQQEASGNTSSSSNGSNKTTSIRPFRCSVCGRRSNWKCDIRKHYRQVHPLSIEAHVELMTKEELLEVGESEKDIEMYYPETKNRPNPNAIKPFRCSVCGKNSRWKWDVTKHIKMVHKDAPNAYVVEDEVEGGNDTGDSNPATPDASMLTEMDDENSQSPSVKSESNQSTPTHPKPNGPKLGCYQCSICSQFSEFMWVIRRHIRSLHPNNPDARIVDVSKKGGDENAPNDSRPYICSLCGKRSNWKWDVKKHIMSVHRGSMGSILDELLSKETVIYADGKTQEVEGSAKDKIDAVRNNMTETGIPTRQSNDSPAPIMTAQNNSCYSSLPTMVGLQSVFAPQDSPNNVTMSQPTQNEQTTYKSAHRHSLTNMWQCGQCDFRSNGREETLLHIQTHDLYNAFQCAICDHGDDLEYNLIKHIKAKHEIDNPEGALLQNMICVPNGSTHSESNNQPGITYTCNECDMRTSWRSAIVRHIKEKHMLVSNINLPERDINTMFTKHGTAIKQELTDSQNRRYNCNICPYKTDKVSMFNEHMTRHKKNSESDAKCPYCDYWVAASRLLHQHLKIHQRYGDIDQSMSPSPSDIYQNGVPSPLEQCPDCPYRGKNKDMNHHRRLHVKRPGADFKCPECPYWVSHQRLLQQHAKVHSATYRNYSTLPMDGDSSLDEITSFKQHLISQSVQPTKLEPGGDGIQRSQTKCNKCPYASCNLTKLENHEKQHGVPTESGLKCKFCDYFADDRDSIAQHIKVHSLQYQGEVDENGDMDSSSPVLDSSVGFNIKYADNDKLILSRSDNTKYCCEKCSYCSANKENFQRHMKLHGSRQGFTCEFCDYSVPSSTLLQVHAELHRRPNKNLLATQSIMNLTKLQPISADIQLAQSAQMVDGQLTEVHDHLELYENARETPANKMFRAGSAAPSYNSEDAEPEFIDLAELGSKVGADAGQSSGDEMEDDEVWICRVCDRVCDSESELMSHEQTHE